MKLGKALQNPFALVLQGFLVGTILVFAPSPFAAAEAGPAHGAAAPALSPES
jgi:hypothetical protein